MVKYAQLFIDGNLPDTIYDFLASAVLMAFCKDAPAQPPAQGPPRVRPIGIGSVLARLPLAMFNRVLNPRLTKMFKEGHQFSYGVSGGVDLVNAGAQAALEANPTWVLLSWDVRNAFNEIARSLILRALQADEDLHGLIPVFLALYGNRTPELWNYGAGPLHGPSCTLHSVEGTRQGCVFGAIFFNIAVNEMYKEFADIIGDQGVLFAIADDCKIAAHPDIIPRVVEAADARFGTGGMKLEKTKSRVYVPLTARAAWCTARRLNPILKDLNDGRGTGPNFQKSWPEADGMRTLGIPVGNDKFIQQWLEEKRQELHKLQAFIRDVAAAGFQREAASMLKVGASKKLSHLLRGLPRDTLGEEWLKAADRDNICTWLAVHGAPDDYWDSLDDAEKNTLLETLDLPPEMGGDGLASLFLQADEVHHSMWGLVFHELKSFFESRTHTSYRDLATTMNLMFDNTEEEDSGDSSDPGPATEQATVQPPWMVAALAAEEGAHSHSDLLTLEERAFAARVIEGEHHVKTAGVETPMWGGRQKPVPLDEPILFTFEDYRNARVKHSAAPARLTRHIRQLSIVYKKSFPRARAKLLSRCGAAGRAQADTTHKDVSFVALIKGVPAAKDWTHEGELYAISQLHRFGLPYGSELSVAESFPNDCSKCGGHVVPAGLVDTMPDACKLKLWADHTSNCGGGPANHKAHGELNTLVVKGVLTAPEAGPLFREDEIRVEPRNHRPDDKSKPADFDHSDLAHPGQLVLGDPACVSAVCNTYLDGSARSVAYAAAQEERNKFKRNEDSSLDVRQKGDRLVPMVMSEHGAMGAHFKAYLEELATLAVNKPGGVQSMRGTFAVSKYVAKAMLVRRWTARIVWGMQRQAAAQILATWRANAFLRSRSQSAAAGGSPAVGAAVPPARALGMSTEVGILLDDLD